MDINTSKIPYQYGSNYGFGIYSCGGRFDLTVTADSW